MVNTGLACYALMHPKFKPALALGALRRMEYPRLSVLWRTFGENYGPLLTYLRFPKKKMLEIYLLNTVGHRNNRLGKYEFLYGLGIDEYRQKLTNKDPILTSRLHRYFASIAKTLNIVPDNGTDLFIAPELESNNNEHAFNQLAGIAKSHFPTATIVWNPVNNNHFGANPISGYKFELHGSQAKLGSNGIANLDGEAINFEAQPAVLPNKIEESELKSYTANHSQCIANFLWVERFNMIGPGGFVDPRQRDTSPTPLTYELLERYL